MLEALITFAPLLVVVGLLAGFLAGLFGIGGGLVVVPAVYFLMLSTGLSAPSAMAIAVGTSLTSIIPTSLSSMRAHHTLGNVDWTVFKRWGPFVFFGVLLGASLVSDLQSKGLVVVFAVLLMAVAVHKLLPGTQSRQLATFPHVGWQRVTAFAIGFVSAMAGVGGGATGVPALTFFGLSMHKAVGTCAALGLVVAFPGAIILWLTGQAPSQAPAGTLGLVYLPALLVIVPLTLLLAPVGAKVGKAIPSRILKRLFAGVLLVVSARMLLSL